MFSRMEIWSDIAFAISIISCFAKNLSYEHTEAIKTIMQYLKATYTLDIIYERERQDLIIKSFSDFD